MALEVNAASGDYINHGSGATLDNLEPWTVMVWVTPTTFATTFAAFVSKNNSERLQNAGGANSNNPAGAWQKTPSTFYVSAHELDTTQPWCIAAVHDDGAGAGERFQIYVGDLDTALSETTYNSIDEGGSSTPDDSAGDLGVGGFTSGTKSLRGVYYAVLVWGRAVSLSELDEYRRFPWKAIGSANLALLSEYGWHTGVQRDASGNGNTGTPVGLVVAVHAPLMNQQRLVSCGVIH